MANRDLPPSLAIGYLDDDPTHGDDPPPEPPSFPYGSDRDPPSYSPSSRSTPNAPLLHSQVRVRATVLAYYGSAGANNHSPNRDILGNTPIDITKFISAGTAMDNPGGRASDPPDPPARAVTNPGWRTSVYNDPSDPPARPTGGDAADPGSRPTKFNMIAYIQLCSGIGISKTCFCLCCCWYFIILVGGILIAAIIPSITYPEPGSPYPFSGVILSVLAGLAFILQSVFWCVTLIVFTIGTGGWSDPRSRIDLDFDRNYTLLSCCCWMITIFFVSVATGNIVNVYSGNDLVSLPIVYVMWIFLGLFVCGNMLTYCWFRKRTGRVFCCC